MARDPKVELLGGVPLFARCSKHDLEEIASIVDEIDLPAGKTLIREGESRKEFVVLALGARTWLAHAERPHVPRLTS